MFMGNTSFIVCCLLFIVWTLGPERSYSQLGQLLDGDRVVFVGDGFIERAQRFGYIEAALTSRWPERQISFRNIGWSGDTVKGEARDHYTNPPTAYEHLLEQIAESDPTVLIFAYGSNLAYGNDAEMDAFSDGYHTLLNDVELNGKRCLLLSPIPHDQKTSPHPDVSAFNANLEKVAALISEIADKRGCAFFDLYSLLANYYELARKSMYSNGIHLSDQGYALVGEFLKGSSSMGGGSDLVIDLENETLSGGELLDLTRKENGFTLLLRPSQRPVRGSRSISIKGLRRGSYRVSTPSGIIGSMNRAEWNDGSMVTIPEENQQEEQLRAAIIEKNALYFRKYRPQNETYLVGFRKYEQGQNAVELDLLDPLIHEKENEIGRLKAPKPITLTIERL